MFKFNSIFAVVFAALGSSAHASGGVSCYSKDKNVNIGIGMGRVPIYAPLNASAKYGDKEWSSNPQNGEIQMGGSQGMIEENRLAVDFADDNVENIIISLRVNLSAEESESGFPGTLTFEDGVVHQVDCEFE